MARDYSKPGPLEGHFDNHGLSDHGKLWDSLWKGNNIPWDRGQPSLALYDLLVERPDLVPSPSEQGADSRGRSKTAFVPGCGKGWDVLLLAAFGYHVIGLETSERALEEAKALLQAVVTGELQQIQEGSSSLTVLTPRNGVGPLDEDGAIAWVVGNFFTDDFLQQTGQKTFDVIFDYQVCRGVYNWDVHLEAPRQLTIIVCLSSSVLYPSQPDQLGQNACQGYSHQMAS
jgi:methyl halide transferase